MITTHSQESICFGTCQISTHLPLTWYFYRCQRLAFTCSWIPWPGRVVRGEQGLLWVIAKVISSGKQTISRHTNISHLNCYLQVGTVTLQTTLSLLNVLENQSKENYNIPTLIWSASRIRFKLHDWPMACIKLFKSVVTGKFTYNTVPVGCQMYVVKIQIKSASSFYMKLSSSGCPSSYK